jgi:hypothetical protein
MKSSLLFIFTIISFNCSAQKKYLNTDGSISSEAKRDVFVATFKDNADLNRQYAIENKDFVIIAKYDCTDDNQDTAELQKRAMSVSFSLVLEEILALQKMGFETLQEIEFEGIIFKTNYLCADKTRRYHFYFTLIELKSFPEYMDFDELFTYVVVTNHNRNIIYVKNER